MKTRKHYYIENETIKKITKIAKVKEWTQTYLVNWILTKGIKDFFKNNNNGS